MTIGSGQQSVTGVDSADDSNSYWRIRGKPGDICQRGSPIQCGQQIRITHMTTGRNLHSHHFSSPLSNNQVRTESGDDAWGSMVQKQATTQLVPRVLIRA